jgi:hypothetical protein
MTIGPAAPIFSPQALEIDAAGAHQHDVDLGEVELLQVLAFEGLAAERDFHADGFTRGDGMHLVHGELQFLEDIEHLTAHIARGADHGDPVTHRSLQFDCLNPPSAAGADPLRPGRLGSKNRLSNATLSAERSGKISPGLRGFCIRGTHTRCNASANFSEPWERDA